MIPEVKSLQPTPISSDLSGDLTSPLSGADNVLALNKVLEPGDSIVSEGEGAAIFTAEGEKGQLTGPAAPGAVTKAAEGDEPDEEMGFIRSSLSWLRENVANNMWVRGTAAIASFVVPGGIFITGLLFLLDAVLLVDKLIAGEEVGLRDVLPVVAGFIGIAADSNAIMGASQLMTAGWDYWDSLGDDEKKAGELPSDEDITTMKEAAAAKVDGTEEEGDGARKPGLLNRVSSAFASVTERLGQIAGKEGSEDEQKKLSEQKGILLEIMGTLKPNPEVKIPQGALPVQ